MTNCLITHQNVDRCHLVNGRILRWRYDLVDNHTFFLGSEVGLKLLLLLLNALLLDEQLDDVEGLRILPYLQYKSNPNQATVVSRDLLLECMNEGGIKFILDASKCSLSQHELKQAYYYEQRRKAENTQPVLPIAKEGHYENVTILV